MHEIKSVAGERIFPKLTTNSKESIKERIQEHYSPRVTNLAIARKEFISSLSISDETVLLEMIEKPTFLFDSSTLKFDLEQNQKREFLAYEACIYKLLQKFLQSEKLVGPLIVLYEDILEHLCLLSHMDDHDVIASINIQEIVKHGDDLIDLVLGHQDHLQSIRNRFEKFNCHLSDQNLKDIKALKSRILSDKHITVRYRLGQLYFSLQDPQRALYHYKKAISFFDHWRSVIPTSSSLEWLIYQGQIKIYQATGHREDEEKTQKLALKIMQEFFQQLKIDQTLDKLDLPKQILFLIERVKKQEISLFRASRRARQLLTQLEIDPQLSLNTKRKVLAELLCFPNEWVQQEALKALSCFLNIKELPYDVEMKQFQAFLALERKVNATLELYLCEKKSQKLIFPLLSIYQNVLERLWLLPYLVEGKNPKDYVVSKDMALIPNQFTKLKKLFALRKEESSQMYLCIEAIQKGVDRVVNPVQESVIELIKTIKFALLSEQKLIPCILGMAHESISDYYCAVYYHEIFLESPIEEFKKQAFKRIEKAYDGLGIAYHSLKDYTKAIEIHKKQLEIAQVIGDRCIESSAYCNLGITYKSLEDYPTAIDMYQKQLKIAQEMQDRHMEMIAYTNLGNAYHSLENYPTAIEMYEESLVIIQIIGDLASAVYQSRKCLLLFGGV